MCRDLASERQHVEPMIEIAAFQIDVADERDLRQLKAFPLEGNNLLVDFP